MSTKTDHCEEQITAEEGETVAVSHTIDDVDAETTTSLGDRVRDIAGQVQQYADHLSSAAKDLPLVLLFFHIEVALTTLRGGYANLDILRQELANRRIDMGKDSKLKELDTHLAALTALMTLDTNDLEGSSD